MIRVDNRSEFISRDLDLWVYQRDVVLDFSRPGKATDNAYVESFNGNFWAECLNQHRLLSFDGARQKMEEWRRDYNEVRPHSAIGNKPPIWLMNAYGASGLPEVPPGKSPSRVVQNRVKREMQPTESTSRWIEVGSNAISERRHNPHFPAQGEKLSERTNPKITKNCKITSLPRGLIGLNVIAGL